MNAALVSIDRSLRVLRRTILLDLLAPPIGKERVRRTLVHAELPPSREMEELYAWHGGTVFPAQTRLGDIYLVPGFYLLTLSDAITNYRAFEDHERWTRGWIPLFADGGGDFYVVDLRPEGGGAVRHFMIDQEQHPVIYESITAMMETAAAAFDAGVYFVDGDGYLNLNDEEFAKLASDRNPSVAWWSG